MTQVGDRVELVRCNDPYTKLVPGELGTVTLIDSMGTVHVAWDSGARLGMIREDGDDWRVVQGTRTRSDILAAGSLSAEDVLNTEASDV